MAFDEATARMVEQRAASGMPPLHTMTAEQARAWSGRPKPGLRGPEMTRVEHTLAQGEGPGVPVDLYVPTRNPAGVILYFHGGGWTLGSAAAWGPLARHLAAATNCTLVVAEYRLAPEEPYPAAVDDAWSVTTWAAGWWDGPLAVAGDSAGGNLAAVAALRARDTERVRLAAQMLAYPVTDFDFTRASYVEPENQHILPRETMAWFWDNYLPQQQRAQAIWAAPLRAATLAELPPSIVVTAEHDVLRDEGAAYTDRLAEAGVPVSYRCFRGQGHGFLASPTLLPAADDAIVYIAERLQPLLSQAERRR